MPTILKSIAAIAVAGYLNGCAVLLPHDLARDGTVEIETEGTVRVRVARVDVRRESDQTVVRGETEYPIWQRFSAFKGHIDIDMIGPDGAKSSRHGVALKKKLVGAGQTWPRAYFAGYFQHKPGKGTVVRVVYHSGQHVHDKEYSSD